MSQSIQYTLGSPEEKRAFYRRALRITAPIALQNFMDAAVNAADVIMMLFVSGVALSASSLANQIAFVLSMLLFGVSSGASVLSAQYWGKGDKRSVEKVMSIALRISVLLSLFFTLAALLMPETLMRLYTDDQALIETGARYLRVLSFSYVLNGFVTVYLSVMRSVERVAISATVHCSAVLLNVALNACFIFGFGPFPKLGIEGVALATTITRALEMIVCLIDTRCCKVIRLRIRDFVTHYAVLFKDFVRYAIPSAANDIIWGLAFSVYVSILGHISSDIVAANAVASVIRSLCTVVCFGVSSSAAIILGKEMGENRLEEARAHASRFVLMSVLTALIGGVIILLAKPLVMLYLEAVNQNVNDTVRDYLRLMLYINAYYIIGQSVNTMLICGIFRAGGDVRFGLYCDTIAMWGYAVPVGLLCAFVLKLPPMTVYFILCLDEFVKMPVVIAHYKRRKWLNNVTRESV